MSAAPESVVNPPSVEAVALVSTAVTRRDFSGDCVVNIDPKLNPKLLLKTKHWARLSTASTSQTTAVIIIKP